MEKMATFGLANSLSENTSLGNHVGFKRVKLLTETASLLSDSTLNEANVADANLVKLPTVIANSVSLPIVEKNHSKGVKSVYELEYIPLWGPTRSLVKGRKWKM